VKKELTSVDEMKTWASTIGSMLAGGEYVELIGDVGAGKTTFAKGLAAGLAIEEVVQSPTFTISRVYDGRDGLRLAHYDFYRLADPGIMADELSETLHDEKTVTVIEWGDIVSDVRPADYLRIVIESPSETVRQVTMTAHGERSSALLERLR
jgi:tRNA threonylcarbamoyladenosine biosynthesis protein TsaE